MTVMRYKRDFLYIALSVLMMAADWLLLFEVYARIGINTWKY